MKNKNLFIGILIIVLIVVFFIYKNTKNEQNNIILDTLLDTQKTEDVSTKPSPTPQTTTSIKTKIQSNSYVNKDGYYVMQYTNNGFVPKTLQIPKGKAVKFINLSDSGMRIFTTDTSSVFTQLNQAGTVSRGEIYTMSLPDSGLWNFHNQSNPSHSASILVY